MTLVSDADSVLASLEPFGRLPGWLAAPMDPARVARSLTAHVPELAQGWATVSSCAPERLRAKDDSWVARYRLGVMWPGEPPHDVVLVGRLWAPSQDDPPTPQVVRPFGQAGWAGWLPDLRLELRHEVADGALPALPMLTEPAAAADLLGPILRDAGYAGATIASCQPTVVRYKPGSRCTVVVRVTYAAPSDPAPPTVVVLKTHQGDKGQTAWEAMNALWERTSWRGALDLAEPLAFLPEQRILVQGPVPEELTLKELARRTFASNRPDMVDELRSALGRTGSALAALHRSGAEYGSLATLDDELDEVEEVIDRLALTVPALEGAAGPLLRRLRELSAEHPAERAVPSHHDFRPAQVLLDHGSLGFIDFDGASMAEPALDLGRFRAKLRDIGISSLIHTGQPLSGEPLEATLALIDDLCEHFLSAYLERAEVSRQRVLLWETCDLITGMLHAWTKVRLARLEPRLALLQHQLGSSGLVQQAV